MHFINLDHASCTAVIPVTDPDHALLPLHFSVDPGTTHDWQDLPPRPDAADHLNLLNSYLELVRVPLPEWLIDAPPPAPPPPQHPVPPNSGHIVNVYEDYQGCRGPSKTSKQIQSVAKQFGSIGKKLKKNFGNMLTRNGSLTSGKHHGKSGRGTREQAFVPRKIVSGSQSFILGAVILTTDNLLPYQDEMIDNYLQV